SSDLSLPESGPSHRPNDTPRTEYGALLLESVTSNTIPDAVLRPAHMNANVCCSYTVTPITLKYISIQIRTELMNMADVCFTCRSPPKFSDHQFSGVTGVTGVTRIASQRTLTLLRNTKVTPDKLFEPSGVTPMFTAVVNRPMLVYDVYVLR